MGTNYELGDFLRSRRQRLKPIAGERTPDRLRRTPGLRREEVAERAGISIDWYIRLEQGRAVSPSLATVDALARALDLSEPEHAHLRSLAGCRPIQGRSLMSVPHHVCRLLDHYPHPAYVTSRRWDLLAWNAATTELFFDFAQLPPMERNLLLLAFAHPHARTLFGQQWTETVRAMLAQFRSVHDHSANDPAFTSLVAQLHRRSAEFTQWWASHDIQAPLSGRKTLLHPKRGAVVLDHASFQCNDDTGMRLVLYVPV